MSETGKDSERIVDEVRTRYGRIAGAEPTDAARSGCCGEAPLPSTSAALGYDGDELTSIPAGADLGVGCGAPIAELRLAPGETVLDLGSGAGLDAFLAARRVGPEGRVYGVDMTPEMIERARRNAEQGNYANVEFRLGRLESLPFDDASVDAITSNCVINLVPDKGSVFREAARVLRPGGRIVISDIMLAGSLPEAVAKSVAAWVGCVAGALEREHYFEAVRTAGLTDLEVVRDVDYLAGIDCSGGELPPDLRGILDGTGVTPADLAGVVRSVTFRAIRPRS